MTNKEEKITKFLITGTSIAIGIGLKTLFKKGWVKKYDEEPPGMKTSEKIDWGKLVLWTFVTGLILRVIKVGIKRSLSVAIEKNNLLT